MGNQVEAHYTGTSKLADQIAAALTASGKKLAGLKPQ